MSAAHTSQPYQSPPTDDINASVDIIIAYTTVIFDLFPDAERYLPDMPGCRDFSVLFEGIEHHAIKIQQAMRRLQQEADHA